MEFNQVLQNTTFEDLKVEQFREAMKKVVPRSEEFADSVIIAFIKAYTGKFTVTACFSLH